MKVIRAYVYTHWVNQQYRRHELSAGSDMSLQTSQNSLIDRLAMICMENTPG